ncbi:IS66 family transposase [Candidatus Tisiphia endosymbiont of Beris chalybata]|uniref:IS66 family transposase n=1 Tax=Candidatus Tisiphia endosymbiont of Beris chalybata TaxID=3066262 RepID=UPI003977B132
MSKKLENKYNALVKLAGESSYLHFDETSSNNKGKRHWCWVAANSVVTVFKLASSRGKKVLESFLPEYEGKVISDRYAVYNIFKQEKRQICLAHLRRDFKRFAYSKHNNLAEIGKNLLAIIDTVFRFYKLDLLHNLKIIEEFLGETKSSTAAYIDVREEQRGVSTTKLPIRLGYARGLLCLSYYI